MAKGDHTGECSFEQRPVCSDFTLSPLPVQRPVETVSGPLSRQRTCPTGSLEDGLTAFRYGEQLSQAGV